MSNCQAFSRQFQRSLASRSSLKGSRLSVTAPTRKYLRGPPVRTVSSAGPPEFGARDPTAGELESGFGNKTLGMADTSHIIRGPAGMEKLFGLATKKCKACEGGTVEVLEEERINVLQNQVPGWQLSNDQQGVLCLRQEWKVKNFKAGLDLFKRIGEVAEEEGHHPNLHLEGYNRVSAELNTHSVGGLTENDFIMAAKINQIPVSDLKPKPKPKYWA